MKIYHAFFKSQIKANIENLQAYLHSHKRSNVFWDARVLLYPNRNHFCSNFA